MILGVGAMLSGEIGTEILGALLFVGVAFWYGAVWWLWARRVTAMAKQRPPVYSGVFFSESEMRALRVWFKNETGLDPLPSLPKDPHLTVAFKPPIEEVAEMPLGYKARLTVIGYAADEKGQAVLVKGFPSDRLHPHVTLSTAPGVPPAYTKDLLAAGVTQVRGPTIEGVVGYYDGEVKFKIELPPETGA